MLRQSIGDLIAKASETGMSRTKGVRSDQQQRFGLSSREEQGRVREIQGHETSFLKSLGGGASLTERKSGLVGRAPLLTFSKRRHRCAKRGGAARGVNGGVGVCRTNQKKARDGGGLNARFQNVDDRGKKISSRAGRLKGTEEKVEDKKR